MDGCDYEIVGYRPEFREQILQLQQHLWGPDVDINSAYLKWKYEENPYLDTTLIYLALCKEKVVGMRGFYGAKWEVAIRDKPHLFYAQAIWSSSRNTVNGVSFPESWRPH